MRTIWRDNLGRYTVSDDEDVELITLNSRKDTESGKDTRMYISAIPVVLPTGTIAKGVMQGQLTTPARKTIDGSSLDDTAVQVETADVKTADKGVQANLPPPPADLANHNWGLWSPPTRNSPENDKTADKDEKANLPPHPANFANRNWGLWSPRT
ncbi:unnamed protein product [Periconia digitata]|uniref:Uncharacterized protein n=1 Tax=Periconia digitata TaxID=1303443 RepID=A0A9W4UJE6_9PLEO|nr:unnamed protein product [Periconia digitata]